MKFKRSHFVIKEGCTYTIKPDKIPMQWNDWTRGLNTIKSVGICTQDSVVPSEYHNANNKDGWIQ